MKKDSEAIFTKITSVYEQGDAVQKENAQLEIALELSRKETATVKEELQNAKKVIENLKEKHESQTKDFNRQINSL